MSETHQSPAAAAGDFFCVIREQQTDLKRSPGIDHLFRGEALQVPDESHRVLHDEFRDNRSCLHAAWQCHCCTVVCMLPELPERWQSTSKQRPSGLRAGAIGTPAAVTSQLAAVPANRRQSDHHGFPPPQFPGGWRYRSHDPREHPRDHRCPSRTPSMSCRRISQRDHSPILTFPADTARRRSPSGLRLSAERH